MGKPTGWCGWLDPSLGLMLALASLGLLVATLGDPGMTWDEGYLVEREERLEEWFARVAGKTTAASRAWTPTDTALDARDAYLRQAGASARSPWSRDSLRFYWQFGREQPHGHPPFFAWLGLAGWCLTRHLLPPLESYRFGPAALFALTVGLLYHVQARRYGRWAGLASALGLLTMPRVFAHAHLASYDAPLLGLWLLSAFAFLAAGKPGRAGAIGTGLFGLLLGLAASTKLTGWFLPIPLGVWAIAYRDRRALRALLVGGLIALVVTVGLNPSWWSDPVGSLGIFLASNLTRAGATEIPSYFFGRVYPFSLPWYNTLVLTALVVPPASLALGLAGAVAVVSGRFRDRAGTLFLVNWVFLLALRALPTAPGHDVERQFLPAFGCLAALMAPGVASLAGWFARWPGARWARGLTAAVVIGTLGASALSTWRYHPLQLSYYNILIGGLSGATRAGMEPTYYWDALTPDVLQWINTHTEPNRTVIVPFRIPTFDYLHHWGRLRPSPQADATNRPKWFLVLNRAGHLHYYRGLTSSYLMEHGRPAFVKRLDVAPDVPLIAIYPITEAMRATAAQDATR